MRTIFSIQRITIVVACLLFSAFPLFAQSDLFITNAHIITGTGEEIDNGSIYIKDGKILAIGKDIAQPKDVTVVDAKGQWAMPGIIDEHSHMAMESFNEATSQNSAMVDITDVVRHDDYSLYRALASGVTTVHGFHGSANVIGGRDEVIKIKWGRDRETIIIENNPEGLKFALGENPIRGDSRYPNSRMGIEHILRNEFIRAQEYKKAWETYEAKKSGKIKPSNSYEKKFGPVAPKYDMQMETLVGVLKDEIRSHIHAYSAQEMTMFSRIGREFGFHPTSYEHVLEGYKVADELAEAGTVSSMFVDFWNYKVEASNAIPFGAALLNEKGVKVAIHSDSDDRVRRLQLDAAKTIRYGNMPRDEAFRTITYNAALGMRLEERIGLLKVGMDGDVAIFDGDPLSVFSKCVKTIIEGEIFFDRDKAMTTEKWIKEAKKANKISFEGGK